MRWGIALLLSVLAGCASAPGAAARADRCPLGRDSGAMFCAEIVRWARDPASGQCCRYDTVCAAPTGWKTFTTRDACEH